METTQTPPSKTDNIKELFEEILDRKKFFAVYAEAFKVSPLTAEGNHFAKFWRFGRIDLDEVIRFMQNYIANQPKE